MWLLSARKSPKLPTCESALPPGSARGRRRERNGLGALGLACFVSAAGCTTDVCQSDSDTRALPYRDGHTNSEITRYETNRWDEPWLTFPSGARYRIEHGLGREPELDIWLSMKERPIEQEEPITASAGNETHVWNVTRDFVELSNGTCADLFLRVVAWVDPGTGEIPSVSK
jgi:hypothetical protein